MKKYTVVFAASYLLLTLVLGFVAVTASMKSGAGFGFAAALAAAFIASWRFTKERNRRPTTEEARSFAWQALFSVWAIALVLTSMVLYASLSGAQMATLRTLPTLKLFWVFGIGAVLLLSVVHYFAIRWSFAWYAKITLKGARGGT